MVKIYNSTKNVIIADSVKVAQNFITRTLGLIPRKSIFDGEALIIKPCCSVHTFLMKFPIDILFVDKNNKIIALYENVSKNKILPVHLSASYVVEMKAGQISNYKIEKCDIIQIDEY